MQEMANIAKGNDPGNSVSLLGASGLNPNQSMLILQECCTDAYGSLVVYAPIDVGAMHLVMSGGDSSYISLLPSGFAIVREGSQCRGGTRSSRIWKELKQFASRRLSPHICFSNTGQQSSQFQTNHGVGGDCKQSDKRHNKEKQGSFGRGK